MINSLSELVLQESLDPGRSTRRQPHPGSPWGVYRCAGEDDWCVITVRDDRTGPPWLRPWADPAWAVAPDLGHVRRPPRPRR